MRFLFSIILFLLSIISHSKPISFSHNGETMEIELQYNNIDDIKLRITYDSSQEIEVIYFWLNERIGLKQSYIHIQCIDCDSGYINISEEYYKKIAYNLHSISIGNKWKLVSKNKSYLVREYFVEQQILYYIKQYHLYKKENEKILFSLQQENEELKSINKKLETSLKEFINETSNVTITNSKISYKIDPSYTYERTTESERVYPPKDSNGKPKYKYKYKYYRNGKWRYRY